MSNEQQESQASSLIVSHDSPDNDLVNAALDGSHKAFDFLVRRYCSMVFKRITAVLRGGDGVEDVFQEFCMQFWRSLKKFDQSQSLKGFLSVMATNKAHDYRRARDRHPMRQLSVPAQEDEETYHEMDPAGREDTLAPLHEKDRDRVLDKALADLNSDLRQVIILQYYQGLTQKKIVELLGIGMTTLHNRLYEARRILSELPAVQALLA